MKTKISKTISIKKKLADYESLDVSVGYEEEIEYENDNELNDRIEHLNKKINTQVKKSFEYLHQKYWGVMNNNAASNS